MDKRTFFTCDRMSCISLVIPLRDVRHHIGCAYINQNGILQAPTNADIPKGNSIETLRGKKSHFLTGIIVFFLVTTRQIFRLTCVE